MKNLFVLLFTLFCFLTLNAQDDRFIDINAAKGKDVYVCDNSAVSVAYMVVDGKVKPLSKIKKSQLLIEGKTYTIERELYTFKKKTYIVLENDSETLLLKEEDAPLYLSSFVSKSYWQEKYNSYSNDYTYIDFKRYYVFHSVDANVEYDDLSHIEWRGLEITKNGAVYYLCEYNGTKPLNKFDITNKFFEEYKDIYFIKKDNIQPYIDKYKARIAKEKRDKEIADSIANSKLRLAVATDEATFTVDERTINVYKGDTLAIFSYKPTDDKYVARFHLGNLLFEPSDIEFLDTKTTTTEGKYSWERKTIKTSKDADFLKSQGEKGREQRFDVAEAYDDVQTKIWLGKLKSAIDDYNKEVAYKKKNQIFITGIGYDYDSNEYSSRFGMHFDVYNCFSKTIKYVEFTMTNYNAVGDVQRDDIGRATRTVKGIGPIEPEDGGRYSWDDIFWDDRDVIRKTRLTNVKFIFTDGTTKSFSGYANINKHMTSDAWDD